MDPVTTLLVINLVFTAITPIITAVGFAITHIRSSRCCGGEILMREPTRQRIEPPKIKNNNVEEVVII